MTQAMTARLLAGDNLPHLAALADASVDLVYLDPPFNSGAHYGLLSAAGDDAGLRAFEDVWRWDEHADAAFDGLCAGGSPHLARAMEGFELLLERSPTLAYLAFLAPRLVELRRVLRDSGSIYLHCNWAACQSLKLLLDAIFGAECFLNHIVWVYGLGGSSPRFWPRKHDDLLWYGRTAGAHYFVADRVEASSRRMAGRTKKAPDYWDIPTLNNMAKERTGYPTQKPEALLERVIRSSCPADGIVLDPFCGAGTTPAVADRLGRGWIAMDAAVPAIETTARRLGLDGPENVT
jgi:DNA modification methylase